MQYQRNLPHIMPPGATLFVTFRLAGSLPGQVIEQLKIEYAQPDHTKEDAIQSYARQRRYFGAFDQLLDTEDIGPTWLRQAEIAAVVSEALHFRAGREYALWAYCLMANHVHLLVSLPDVENQPFYRILQSELPDALMSCWGAVIRPFSKPKAMTTTCVMLRKWTELLLIF